MKQLSILALFTLILINSLYAKTQDQRFEDLNNLLANFNSTTYNSDLSDSILEESRSLSIARRLQLYEIYEKNAVLPTLLNSTIGFGIGDFMQGHTQAGMLSLAGNMAGVFALWLSTLDLWGDMTLRSELMVLGFVITPLVKISDIIRPLRYADDFNFKLKKVLGLDYETGFRIQPVIQISSDSSARIDLTTSFEF